MNYTLQNLGLSEEWKQEAAEFHDGLIGRVASQHKDLYTVITENNELLAKVSGKFAFSAQSPAEFPAVGDWVIVKQPGTNGDTSVIHHVLTRKSLLERKAAGTGNQSQIVSVNMDTIFITMSLNSDFNLRRIERYLSIAWDSNAVPVIALTKADLCENIGEKLEELAMVACGVDVVVTSSLNEDGMKEIRKYASPGKTAIFIGSSGVGKSSLINKLMGKEILDTGGIREDDDKGRHTTTHRQMLILPTGGVVIDTPGMREIQIEGADLTQSFADIEALAARCRFNDCSHKNEPDCAVKEAISNGTLTADRYKSYTKLQRELLYQEMKGQQREREKINQMFGSMNALKQMKKQNKLKNKR